MGVGDVDWQSGFGAWLEIEFMVGWELMSMETRGHVIHYEKESEIHSELRGKMRVYRTQTPTGFSRCEMPKRNLYIMHHTALVGISVVKTGHGYEHVKLVRRETRIYHSQLSSGHTTKWKRCSRPLPYHIVPSSLAE